VRSGLGYAAFRSAPRELTEEDARLLAGNLIDMAPEVLLQGLPNGAGFAAGMAAAFWFL